MLFKSKPFFRCLNRAGLLASIAFTSVSVPALAQSGWSPSTTITPAFAFFADVSLDNAGNSDVAWLGSTANGRHNPVFSRSGSGNLTLQQTMVVPPSSNYREDNNDPTPRIHVNAGGTTTVVYEQNYTVYAADKPDTGIWPAAKQISAAGAVASLTGIVAHFNNAGDGVAAWVDVNSGQVMATTRSAGASWSAPMAITPAHSTGGEVVEDVAVSEDSSAVVSFETYDVRPPHSIINYQLYTSGTAAVGHANWVISPLILGPDDNAHGGALAVATNAHTGLMSTRGDHRIVAFAESRVGGAWSGPTLIGSANLLAPIWNGYLSQYGLPSNTLATTFASDAAGNSSFLAVDASTNTLELVTGSLTGNNWLQPLPLSAAGEVQAPLGGANYALGVAPDGSAVAGWWSQTQTSKTEGFAMGATRATAGAAFTAPVKLGGPTTPYVFSHIPAVNASASSGHKAEVIWYDFNGAMSDQQISASVYK